MKNSNTYIIFLLIAVSFSFTAMDCKDEPPIVVQPPTPVITLTADDIGVTEVWLTLKTQNVTLPSNIILQRNGVTVTTFTLTTRDTVLADTTAQPKQNYAYSAILQSDTSSQLHITTMDTTSHNFTWQTFTFGGQEGTGSSILYDVAVINDTLAYAIGEIVLKDSVTGEIDPQPYSLLRWNGQTWELKKLFFNDNSVLLPRGIFVVSPNDIWFAAGSIFRWDGQSDHAQLVWQRDINQNATIEKLWGSSSTDMYGVGTLGIIVHYNGSSWTKIESGTTVDIQDIFGSQLRNNNQFEIIAVGGNNGSTERIILQINSGLGKQLNDAPLEYPINGIWFSPYRQYWIVGAGIYQKRILSDSVWRNDPLQYTTFYTRSICGTDINNIFIAGDFGELLHYNGVTMKSCRLEISPVVDIYQSIDVKNKFVVAVGTVGLKSVITVGKQQ